MADPEIEVLAFEEERKSAAENGPKEATPVFVAGSGNPVVNDTEEVV